MEIKRDQYLQELIEKKQNGLIKVITGIRRSGKSFLLFSIYKKYLLENITDQEHIITLAFDSYENRKYQNPDILIPYIKSLIKDNKTYYLLLDEIQLLNDFEAVLNSFQRLDNIDIYVTGSNSKFLSKDVITEFRGRGDEIHIFPLSFKEYMSVYSGDKYEGWADYIAFGGLPLIATMNNDKHKADYLIKLFNETYIKDIISRNHIEKLQELNDLLNVLSSDIGTLTNPSKIEATFRSVLQSNISFNTICQYIEYLKDAYIINEANRYDVKGRKYIGTPVKYYFEDIGLRNARIGFRQTEETHLMENVIYNELRMRGFLVDIGVVIKRVRTVDGLQQKKQLEIDFIATMGSKKYYIQSALRLPDENKMNQEKASLLAVGDSFKKIILVKDIIKVQRDEAGITTMSIFDFLLKENSLDL